MPSCPGCGARLAPDASRCDLCGTEVGATEGALDAPTPPSEPEPVAEVTPLAEASRQQADGQFCPACGTESPGHARFCWRCGAPLAADVAAPVTPSGAPSAAGASPLRPPAASPAVNDQAGQRALVLLGGGAVLVVALFALMLWGPGPAPAAPPLAEAGAPAATPPLPPELEAQVASLEDAIETASTPEERFERRRDLVELLVRAGAFARAGAVQEAIARATGDPLAWADAGSFYLAYMLRAEGPDRAEYARRSAEAYEEALAQNPEDLDVKTDLATAYLNDPTNPMRAVEVVREVLDANPNHARARFNYGLMLAQIGRGEQARDQFEQVLALTDADDLVHERAREEIERLDALAPGG
jgi:cytochrome c-type biogenesis protein CcmH/NrfG/ribosomal protein L40E